MWCYKNVRFIYNNPVDSIFGQSAVVPEILTYVKSKFALMEALRIHIDSSFLGPYTEIDQKTVKFEKPIKV